jgi:hypothetical protein
MLTLLPGAFFPNTLEGTMVGTTMAPRVVVAVFLRNCLRSIGYLLLMIDYLNGKERLALIGGAVRERCLCSINMPLLRSPELPCPDFRRDEL